MLASALLLSRAYTPAQVVGVAGGSVVFKASPPPNFHIREIIWRSLTPSEELVATSFKGTPEIQYRSRFYGRTQLHDNFTLQINPVDLEDAGVFSVLLVDTTGQMKRQVFELKVFDTISTPVIRVFPEAKDANASSETCILFLSCRAASRTNVTYEWEGLGEKTNPGPKHWRTEEGQVLRVQLDPKEALQVSYTCTASNPVIHKSAVVELQDSCLRRSEGEKKTTYNFREFLLIVIPVVSFFFLLAVLSCVCYKQHSGKKMFYMVPGSESIQL
ncbi:SLAM family member 8-like [Protobothrops mucrosquamatus]|uniref:SLAM family member 8-like n=1 Tax=Protobothrops mucrosquamatus TaxID=103944 RepID=UPI0007756359|nr:SLAM family member 8-like [Protobothrops mucrosquamatus]